MQVIIKCYLQLQPGQEEEAKPAIPKSVDEYKVKDGLEENDHNESLVHYYDENEYHC